MDAKTFSSGISPGTIARVAARFQYTWVFGETKVILMASPALADCFSILCAVLTPAYDPPRMRMFLRRLAIIS